MDFRMGVMMAPVMLLGMLLKDRGAGPKFRDAGATGPDHARRPSSLGIDSPRDIELAVRAGVLVPLGDGRYWLRLPRYRRRRAVTWTFVLTVWSFGLAVLALIGLRHYGYI
ncbi:MAG: hypothetical protein AB8G96_08815 [Phycisphaerales bacterium]